MQIFGIVLHYEFIGRKSATYQSKGKDKPPLEKNVNSY